MDRERGRDWHRRLVSAPFEVRLLYLLPAFLCVVVVVKSVLISPRVDKWAYPTWYVEDFLMTSGLGLPDCSRVSAMGNYSTYWPKLCTRIFEPGQAYANVFATRLTGLNFTGDWRRFFLLTAGLKFLAGYLLGTLYADKRPYQLLSASLVFLVPDYSAMYITEARGLSFPILLLGVYSTLAWKRGSRRMFVPAVVCLVLLAFFYLPRMILLAAIMATFGLVVAVRRFDGMRFLTVTTVVFAVVYLFRLQSVIRNLFKYNVYDISKRSISHTFSVAWYNLVGSGGETVPFIVSAPPYGAIALVPVAIVSGLACLRSLAVRRLPFLLDERMIWVCAILVTYVPVSFSASFFWSRIFFEMAVPGLLVVVGEVEQVIDEYGHRTTLITLVIVLTGIMAAGNAATIPDPIIEPYEQDEYEELTTELADRGIGPNTRIYADMKTGAYLVGEHQYEWVYRIISDRNREAMMSVWYGTNATEACLYMKSHADVRYFILNDRVRVQGVPVENYEREPINDTAYRKFGRSDVFTEYFRTEGFVVYRLHCNSGSQEPTGSSRYPGVPRYSPSTSTPVRRAL